MSSPPDWLLLITNLPGHNPTSRMRVWRALKAAGAGLLRDGVYVLPCEAEPRRLLEQQASEIRSAGGSAHILQFQAESSDHHEQLVMLFDRSAEYGEFVRRLKTLERMFSKLPETAARQQLAAMTREAAAIAARDYFPGLALAQMQTALADAEAALNARHAPDEPHAAHRAIRRRDPRDYRGRTWATRERLWIDRVASAWLIRRFIDPAAKFLWLRSVKECPKRAIGFDFDGAEFTHVGTRVTFEVLMVSFGLEQDAALSQLGALVHHLDVGGIPSAEGPGFSTIMAGARALQPNDDALLKVMTPVLDSMYAAYGKSQNG